MARSVFTIVTPIADGGLKPLTATLALIQAAQGANGILDLSPHTFPDLHFAAFTIFGKTLVFESSVDGPVEVFLSQLAQRDGIDTIYSNCEGYGTQPRTQEERLSYLSCSKYFHKPQLHHVSTPYRTATSIIDDDAVRRRLDQRMSAQPSSALPGQLKRRAQGVREYWTWETLKPWLAFVLAVAVAAVVLWLVRQLLPPGSVLSHLLTVFRDPRIVLSKVSIPSLRTLMISVDILLVGVAGWNTALSWWYTSAPEFRDPARPWIHLTVVAAVVGIIAWMMREAHPRWAGSLAVVIVLALMYAARVVYFRCKGERIAMMRIGSGNATPAPIWRELRNISGAYTRQRVTFTEFARNWMCLLVAFGVSAGILVGLANHRWQVAEVWVVALFAEAVWLTLLVGWPKDNRWSRDALIFIAAVTAGEALLIVSLPLAVAALGNSYHAALELPWGIVAGVIKVVAFVLVLTLGFLLTLVPLVAFFVPWMLTLPQPVRTPDAPNLNVLRAVIDQEDFHVQNHMALVANIGPSRIRALTLTIFLHGLRHLFYCSLLQDVWRGKLFGIPTVHSAQWLLLPDGRFLFLSNYDQSFTTYLDDFGLVIGSGIQKIWGQCEGNPGTADLEAFKRFVRAAMVPYQVWYRAYPTLSVRQIWNNEHLRVQLASNAGEEDMICGLRRFGASPKIVPDIQHATN